MSRAQGLMWYGRLKPRRLADLRRKVRSVEPDGQAYQINEGSTWRGWVDIPDRGEPFNSSIFKRIRELRAEDLPVERPKVTTYRRRRK